MILKIKGHKRVRNKSTRKQNQQKMNLFVNRKNSIKITGNKIKQNETLGQPFKYPLSNNTEF